MDFKQELNDMTLTIFESPGKGFVDITWEIFVIHSSYWPWRDLRECFSWGNFSKMLTILGHILSTKYSKNSTNELKLFDIIGINQCYKIYKIYKNQDHLTYFAHVVTFNEQYLLKFLGLFMSNLAPDNEIIIKICYNFLR